MRPFLGYAILRPVDTAESPEPEAFQPELRDFADRIRWVRVFVLRLNSISEIARRLEYPSQTVETWEKGARPRDLIEVARRYHSVAPEVPLAWLLTGSGTIVTKGDAVYNPLSIVTEGLQPFPNFDYPPAKTGPELTLVGGRRAGDGDH